MSIQIIITTKTYGNDIYIQAKKCEWYAVVSLHLKKGGDAIIYLALLFIYFNLHPLTENLCDHRHKKKQTIKVIQYKKYNYITKLNYESIKLQFNYFILYVCKLFTYMYENSLLAVKSQNLLLRIDLFWSIFFFNEEGHHTYTVSGAWDFLYAILFNSIEILIDYLKIIQNRVS